MPFRALTANGGSVPANGAGGMRARVETSLRSGFGVPRRAWAIVACYILLYLSWQAFHWIPANQELVGDLFFWPITGATAVMAWRAGQRARGAPLVQSAWRLVTLATIAYLLGNIAQLVYEVVLVRKPYPSLADIGFLAFYPLMLAALLRFPTPKEDRAERTRRTVDFVIATIAGTMIVWYVVLGPVAVDGGEALTLAVSIAYPVGDLILIIGLASLLMRGTVRASHDSLMLMIAGIILVIVADLVYGHITLHDIYHGGDPVDVAWMLAQGVLLLAPIAQRPVSSDAVEPTRRPWDRPRWLPFVSIAIALALLFATQEKDVFYPDMSIVIATIALACMLIWRQLVVDRAQRRGRHELETVASLQQIALRDGGRQQLLDAATQAVSRRLGGDRSAILIQDPDDGDLRVVAAAGWPESTVGHLTVPANEDCQAGCTLRRGEPVVVDDLLGDTRFPASTLLREQGLRSGVSVKISARRGFPGVLTVHTSHRRRFTQEDVTFLEMVAGVIAAGAERSAAEEEIRHQAVHDGLTGLPNRVLFNDRLTYALTTIRRHERMLAVLFVDLDNFKNINDSLGHGAGDEVLKIAASRLSDCLRPEDTLARMGGDEFAIVLPEIGEAHDATTAAERLLETLRAPLSVGDDHRLVITASIGVALASHERIRTPEELVRNADLAMYASKQAGKGQLRFFTASMHESAVQRLELVGELRRAIAERELSVRYQPIMSLTDGKVAGAEALVRWNHPERGPISPVVFVEIAEESGLIDVIGRFVLSDACDQLQRWRSAGRDAKRMSVAVNVSAHQLRSSNLVADVKNALSRSGLPPDRLILEITESVLIDRGGRILKRMEELKDLGVRLAVDDFGTGYSSLSYLQQFPVDILKIDKSFVDGLGSSEDNDELVGGIISLAHRIHLQTVAEGIETPRQAATLRMMESELGQGFHFARPLTPEEFAQLLSSGGVRHEQPAAAEPAG